MTASDQQIQELLRADDPRVLDLIYDSFGGMLYKLLACLLCNKQDTEDCFQNLFIRIAKKRHLLRGKEKLKAYLMTMARNEAMAFFRSRKRDVDTVTCDESFLVATDPGDPMPVEELSRALAALPLEQREVISLKIYQKMTYDEIGKQLGISLNTAASRYRYGLQKMKELMLQVL